MSKSFFFNKVDGITYMIDLDQPSLCSNNLKLNKLSSTTETYQAIMLWASWTPKIFCH